MIKIVLADDHLMLLEFMKEGLAKYPDFEIVGAVSDGLAAVEAVEKLKPDVLVLDLMIGGVNGLEVTRRLHKQQPEVRIVILSMHGDESYVLEAFRSGAVGYVLKEEAEESLVLAIREAALGHRYLGYPLIQRAIEAYTVSPAVNAADPNEQLTSREKEILMLSAQGKTNRDIAMLLHISRRTVETHRTNVMRKWGLRNNTELLKFAIMRGLIPDNGSVEGKAEGEDDQNSSG